jgi:RNA 3'-terminal phosphate cyclase
MYTKARKAESLLSFLLLQVIRIENLNIQIRSPGYALTLLAESTTSAIHCSEAVSEPGVSPEDIAMLATRASS